MDQRPRNDLPPTRDDPLTDGLGGPRSRTTWDRATRTEEGAWNVLPLATRRSTYRYWWVVALCERPSKHARPEDYGEHTDHNWSGTTWTGHEYCAAANNSSVDGSGTSHKAITNECCSLRLRPRFGGVFFSCTIDAAYGLL